MQVGDVFLPPQVLLHLGTEGREEVVGVHDDVNEGVYATHKCAMAAGEVFGGTPGDKWHHRMMVYVQEGHLAFILAQHKKYSIQ